MKKNYLFSALAASLMLFTSCSQEEIISTAGEPTGGELVTISATLPQDAATRAMATVENYKARCILQLVNASGTAIEGERYVKEVTGDNVTFEFTAPDQTYQCVLWADYIQSVAETLEKDYFYTTSALPSVTLGNLNKNVMFGTEAADAFCGVIENPADGVNITLKRPLAKVNIGSNTPANYEKYTHVSVGKMNVPNNYNILTKQTNVNTTQEIRLDKTAMIDAEAGQWTYFFVFAPVDRTEYTLSIPVTINNEAGSLEDKSATVSVIPVDDNKESNINFTPEGGSGEEPEPGDDMTINVGFDNEYEKPAIEVGAYVNAAGKLVEDAAEAVAIVFDMAADDDIANYNGDFSGKTIKAWAVALGDATQQYWVSGVSALSAIEGVENPGSMNGVENNIKGYANTQAIQTNGTTANSGATFPALEACVNWTTTISETNTSGWYMPAIGQVKRLYDAIANAEASSALGSLGFEGVILSSTHYTNSSGTVPMGVQFTTTDSNAGVIRNQNLTRQYGARPIVTIFE